MKFILAPKMTAFQIKRMIEQMQQECMDDAGEHLIYGLYVMGGRLNLWITGLQPLEAYQDWKEYLTETEDLSNLPDGVIA